MPGKSEKVAVKRLDVDFDVGGALGRIDENLDFRVDFSNDADDFRDGILCSDRIADMRDCDNFCLAGNYQLRSFSISSSPESFTGMTLSVVLQTFPTSCHGTMFA